MDESEDFIDYDELCSATKSVVKKIKDTDNIRVLRGHRGKPSFIVETSDRIIAELRPTENSNYVLYKKESNGKLDAVKKFEDLEEGLKHLINGVSST